MKSIFSLLGIILGLVNGLGSHQNGGPSMRRIGYLQQTESQLEQKIKNSLKLQGKINNQIREEFFESQIDNFNDKSATFQQRYILDNRYFKNQSKKIDNQVAPPILFYSGNEGNIWGFYNNSGFVTDTLAKELGALVIFGEHRYYGKSMPFNEKSYLKENLKYLTIEQIMTDYVEMIKYIQDKYNLKYSPVYAVGGSYGGMLAAWLRMKYPITFDGALASSAPILHFNGSVNPNQFTYLATNSVRKVGGQQCVDLLHLGFYDIVNVQYDKYMYSKIQKEFNLCELPQSPEQVQNLIDILSESIGSMTVVNYPYPTDFLGPLPAWPIQVACQQAVQQNQSMIQQKQSNISQYDWRNILSLRNASQLYYNPFNNLSCLNISKSPYNPLINKSLSSQIQSPAHCDQSLPWDYMQCNQFPMPMGDDPVNSCFTWKSWYEQGFTQSCINKYGIQPKYSFALDYFGGRNPDKDFKYNSNIIFSNGELDPWSSGGFTSNFTDTQRIKVLFIKDAAHHLDLRLPNDQYDPQSVKDARAIEINTIKQWIQKFHEKAKMKCF